MSDNKKKWLKFLIGASIVLIIILGIIWYRNIKKKKAETLALNKLPPINIVPVSTSDKGKTAFVKSNTTKFYNVTTFIVAYTKSNIGEFAGTIISDQTDSGSTAFYKILNTSGQNLYVLKSQVTVK